MKKLSILIAFLVFVGMAVQAQVQISGTVTGRADGLPIPGVSVVVKGQETIGTSTNIDGQYTLTVPNDAEILVYSFVGMREVEEPINGRTTIDVAMEEAFTELDEVVVVAYGVQRKEAKTGAVGVVNNEDLKTEAADNPAKMLQGKVAGVQINNTTGQPGSATQIRIRGISSINAGNEPLYVIDGVPVVSGNYNYAGDDGNVLSTINPNNIESMTVLKDASAASIYGSRAANGVILITTKRGKSGETKFNFTARHGWSTKTNDNDFRFMNPEEILQYNRDAAINAGQDPDDASPENASYYYPESLLDGELTDWWDLVYQTGQVSEYELSVSGGNEKTNFYSSANYFEQEGIKIGTGMTRFNFRTNLDHKVSEKLKYGTSIDGSYTEQDQQSTSLAYANPFWAASSLLPWHNPYNDDGTYSQDLPSNSNSNPLQNVALNETIDKNYKFLGSMYLQYEIIDGLVFKTQNNIDFLSGNGRYYRHPDTPDGSPDGSLFVGNTWNRTLTTTNTLTYSNTFSEIHDVNLLAGYEFQENLYSRWTGSGYGMGADIPYLSNVSRDKDVGRGFSEWAIQSYFGRVDYNYAGRYLLTASVRTDGSSRFGKDNRYGLFWAVGGSWNIHNESFMDGLDMVNMLKFRASYGTNGNDNIGNYESYGVYGSVLYNGNGGLAPAQLANPALTWEENKTYNFGLDFTLYKRFSGTVEYYNRKTTEMLLDIPLSLTTGFNGIRQNIGELENRGIEFSLDADIITGDINWTAGFNIAHNQTELLDLGGEDVISDGFWRRHMVGGGFSDYYMFEWAGVNPANGLGLWYDADGNLTENAALANRKTMGQIQPDYTGGFKTHVDWNGISFDTYFEYKIGHYVYIMERRYTDSDGYNYGSLHTVNSTEYWKEPGDISPNPKPIAFNSTNSNAWGTSRFLERGDYLRWKNLSLSYRIPQNLVEKATLNSATITFNIENVYVWHDVSYWDPERNVTGGGYAIYPQPRTFTLGLKVGF